MQHIDWENLDEGLRRAIEARTGRVRQVRTISAGHCSQLALSLRTGHGGLFLKGLPERDPGTVRQRREAMINCHVLPLAPRLMWHDTLAGWNLLAFEYIPGARHASYRPGSPDLPDVVAAINRLTRIPCPGLPVKEAPQRWGPYVDDPADARLFDGDRLLHTDFNPLNVLMAPGRTWVIDWAWPTRGAAFIDPACSAKSPTKTPSPGNAPSKQPPVNGSGTANHWHVPGLRDSPDTWREGRQLRTRAIPRRRVPPWRKPVPGENQADSADLISREEVKARLEERLRRHAARPKPARAVIEAWWWSRRAWRSTWRPPPWRQLSGRGAGSGRAAMA